jgi:hypothetical protein
MERTALVALFLASGRRQSGTGQKTKTIKVTPKADAVREAVRDAITHCIYGVD